MNVTAQIKNLEATRVSKMARMEELGKLAADADRTMDSAEAEEFDGLGEEIKKIDAELVRMRTLESFNGQRARPVVDPVKAADPTQAGAAQRGPTIIVPSKDIDDKFKGQSFTRMCIAKALAHINGGGVRPSEIAEQRWGKTNPTLVQWIKANEVIGGGTASGQWGNELALADARYTGDFIELLRAATVFDRLPLREAPANVTIKGQDGEATGYWVGESKAIPVSAADFLDVTLTNLQVGAIAAVSKKLVREASPSAEQLITNSLVYASSKRVDQTFFSATAASAGVSPAGILNGLSAISSSGTDDAGVLADIAALYAPFIAAFNASGLVFVTNTAIGKKLQLMRNTLGQKSFPDVSQNGGSLEGDPVFTGDNVNAAHLILMKPSDIYKIGDIGVEVSITDTATLEMSSAPAGDAKTPTAASANLQNLWQQEMLGMKVVRPINYAKRRTSAVAYVNDANYGAVGSP